MACKYYYKGHEFNSESELDDFLIEKHPYESKMGDAVFELSAPQLHIAAKLDDIAKESAELRKEYLSKLNAGGSNVVYGSSGEVILLDATYTGVNKYLSGKTTIDGTLMFPELIKENYWATRKAHWKLGGIDNFTPDEIDEFGITPENAPKILDENQQKQFIDRMENRWKQEAKIGSAFHNALQLCFAETDKKGRYMITMPKDAIRKYILKHLDGGNRKYIPNDEFGNKIINQAVDHAKTLYNELTRKYGDDLMFYPEFMITQDTNEMSGEKPTKLMGIIDLLVVDKSGRVHIIDYKTSVHGYSEFDSAKKLAYQYQLATYQRMLSKAGISTHNGLAYISPIMIQGFKKKQDSDDYEYSGMVTSDILQETTINKNSRIWENIDEYMPIPFKVEITTEDMLNNVRDLMSEWFPVYNPLKETTREDVIEILKHYDKLKPDENGLYKWRRAEGKGSITASTEADFVNKVTNYFLSTPRKRQSLTASVKLAITVAMKEGIQLDDVEFPKPEISESEGSLNLLRDLLSKYCDGSWDIVENNTLEQYGIILFKTKDGIDSPQVDVVRVSDKILTRHLNKGVGKKSKYSYLKNRKYLTGRYENDISQDSNSKTLMLEAIEGNIELMETMAILNQIPSLEGNTIGSIKIVNPNFANGLDPSNEELMYCWRELNRFRSVNGKDRFMSGDIQLADWYSKANAELQHILLEASEKNYLQGYLKFNGIKECTSILDKAIKGNRQEKLKQLMDLYGRLQRIYKEEGDMSELDKVYLREGELEQRHIRLHNTILKAIAQLQGVDFRQQINDHDLFIQKSQIKNIFNILNFKGVSGTYTDNPGKHDSATLNLVTKLVYEAYQNVRDHLQNEKITINKLVLNLRKEKNFGFVALNSVGNLVDLYTNMTEYTADGDFLFKNPNRLLGAEREFLKYALRAINRNRFPKKTEEELDNMETSNDITYYRVPISRGGIDSQISVDGLMNMLKGKLRYLNPKIAYEKGKEAVLKKADETETEDAKLSQQLFVMTNTFDLGEGSNRLDYIKSLKGESGLEHNLEALLYKYLFAYSVKDNMDLVFPMIKASMIHLATQGAILNHPFENDIRYFKNYITNKIFGRSIKNPELKQLNKILGTMKSATAKFILAFNPVQAVYQPLQHILWDASLAIRRPEGGKHFTFKNLTKAAGIVYPDLLHFSEGPTISSAFNETYGLNDMDMNVYNERIGTYKKGVWNGENFMLKCATRPDYYGRLTLFLAEMIGDGCYDAHHIDKDGRLIYDWKKDKRFEAFANGWASDPRYKQQKSLYYTVAKLFETEHARNRDGSLFVLDMNKPMALPRAYTVKQAEGYKSLHDDIMGHYSHEKKSMILATSLGSMWMQFKSYWSSKKNQYLQPGGVRLQGSFELTEMWVRDKDGNIVKKKMFHKIDPNTGEILEELTDEDTGYPDYSWRGQWQEGVMVTMSSLLKDAVSGNLREGWNEKWNNEDESLRIAYLNNIKLFGIDIFMFMVIGSIASALMNSWLDQLKDKNKHDKTFTSGLAESAVKIAATSVHHAFLDFNPIETVGGPIGTWQPLAFTWIPGRAIKLFNAAFDGDKSFYDAVIATPAATRYFQPALVAIKPEAFMTESLKKQYGKL